MQLDQLVKPIDQMSDDELLARLQEIRHRRTVVRPAAQKRVQRAAAKSSRSKVSAMEKLLAGLSDAERIQLMQQLGELEDGSSTAGGNEGNNAGDDADPNGSLDLGREES